MIAKMRYYFVNPGNTCPIDFNINILYRCEIHLISKTYSIYCKNRTDDGHNRIVTIELFDSRSHIIYSIDWKLFEYIQIVFIPKMYIVILIEYSFFRIFEKWKLYYHRLINLLLLNSYQFSTLLYANLLY